jgi:hypothetical protein
VIEVQSVEVDLMKGRMSWQFSLIGDDIEAYVAAADEGAAPVVPPSSPAPRVDFSVALNSQYVALLEDI